MNGYLKSAELHLVPVGSKLMRSLKQKKKKKVQQKINSFRPLSFLSFSKGLLMAKASHFMGLVKEKYLQKFWTNEKEICF